MWPLPTPAPPAVGEGTGDVLKRILAEKRAFVLPLAAAAAVNIVAYALVVFPLATAVAGGEQRAQAARTVLIAAERDQASAAGLVASRDRAREELKRFYGEVLPADLSSAGRMMYLRLAQLARECNLRYERRMLDPERVHESSLGTLKMTMVLQGSYEDIRRFIYGLETGAPFVVIDNVALGQGPEPTGPLALSLQLSTFYRATDDGT